ncbi:MAG: hypothetical protein II010_06150, partial [Oscillospiraceae bacterium]|nr:hypothetical protein [Oscillospiraceae bacterium]
MAGGYSDGAVIIDTGLNNTGFFKDAKQFKAAVQSLKGTVNRVGREMGQSGGAYLKSIQRNARASREFKQELAVLEAQAKKLRDALTNPAAAVDKQIRALEADLEQTKKTMDSMTGPGARMDLDAWDKAKNDVKNLTVQLETLQKRREELSSPEYFQSAEYQQMANAYNAVAEKVQAMRAQVDAAGGSFGNFVRYAGRGAAALMKMAVPGVLRFLRRLAAGAKNAAIQLAKLSGRAVSKGLKTIGTLATRAGKALFGLGRNAKQAGGGFNLSLRNILKYGLGIRSLFVLFNRLRNAIKEGFSALMDNDARVRASVGALSGALNGLKGSMAAAFAPVLTAIAPALTTLINLLATATNYVGMFLAALTGQSYYMAASGISAVGSAAGAASGS